MISSEIIKILINKYSIDYSIAFEFYKKLQNRNELNNLENIIDNLDTFEDFYDYFF